MIWNVYIYCCAQTSSPAKREARKQRRRQPKWNEKKNGKIKLSEHVCLLYAYLWANECECECIWLKSPTIKLHSQASDRATDRRNHHRHHPIRKEHAKLNDLNWSERVDIYIYIWISILEYVQRIIYGHHFIPSFIARRIVKPKEAKQTKQKQNKTS